MKRINLQEASAQIARPTTIRDINRRIVLNYVRDRSPISRADIARESNLHRSTVSCIIEDLIAAGFIDEIGEGVSTGGRRPTLYQLKTGTPVAMGIDITPRLTTIGVADLAGNVLERESFATSPDLAFMTTQIIDRSKALAAKYAEHKMEIGLTVPGLVDQKQGHISHIPYFDWRDWELCGQIEEATGLNVIAENDANATALAELWFGSDKIRKSDTFVTVLVGEGIGTGIVFDGQIYRGEMGAGGEFGHMIAGRSGPVDCSCGSRECWESFASEKALLERYKQLLQQDDLKPNGFSISSVIELALNGEKRAREALTETVHYLGNGISNLIVGLSPQVVVVSGNITRAWPIFGDELGRVVNRIRLAGLPEPLLMPSSLGDSPTLIGAVGLVLARRFGSVH